MSLATFATCRSVSGALLALVATIALAADPPSPPPAPPFPIDLDPPLRDLWSRGSVRFQRQWLIATPATGDMAAIATAAAAPTAGQPLSVLAPDVRWWAQSSWSDTVDLTLMDGRGKPALAYATLSRWTAGDGELWLGADGLVEAWLNGERVFARATPARFAPDAERVPIRLREGENRLYLRLQAPDIGEWRFAARVMERGALPTPSQEIAPEIVPADGKRLSVRTHFAKERKAAAVDVEAIAMGGKVVARASAPRGDTVTFDTGPWQSGAYDVRLSTRDTWGARKVAHLRWYKGDVEAAAQALVQDAASAGNDPRGATLRMLAEMVTARLNDATADKRQQLQPALMEYEELKLGAAPYAGGFVRLAYVDDVDGSVQFCRAYLPFEYTTSQRWPLVLYLHGYNPGNPRQHAWWAADARHNDMADELGVIHVQPHGRGNAQYQGIGERDVLRCLDEARKRFSVDEDRVYLTGDSMGGHGTWWIASRHPHLFAAIAPVFGGWDMRVSPPPGVPMEVSRPTNAYAAFMQESASSFSGAEGLLNVPVLVVHGDVDLAVSVEHSRHVVRMLQRWGYNLRYHEMPGYAHEDLGKHREIVEWLLEHRRDPAPEHVRLRSTRLDGAQAHWVKVLAAQEPTRVIRVDAQVVRPGLVRVDSQNVAALSLALPRELRGDSATVRVVWNGEAKEAQPIDGVIALPANNTRTRELSKRPGLEGPLPHVVSTPFAVVVGTNSRDAQMRRFCEQKADAFAELWQQWQHQPVRMFKDTEITKADRDRYSLILIGGADANAVTRAWSSRLPLKTSADAVTVDGRRFAASDAVAQMIYPHPSNTERYVMVVAATSPAGMYFWRPSLLHPSIGFPLIQTDWQITDGRRIPKGEHTDVRVASGIFDSNWRLHETSTLSVDPERRAKWAQRRAPPPDWKISAAALQANAGRYELPGGMVVTVVVEGDTLVGKAPGQPDTRLIAESETSFSGEVGGESIEFVRDAQGRVTGMEVGSDFGQVNVARRLY